MGKVHLAVIIILILQLHVSKGCWKNLNQVTDAELDEVANAIWMADTNGLKASDYEINKQANSSNCFQRNSTADKKILSYLNTAVPDRTTFKALTTLWSIYDPIKGHKTSYNSTELKMITTFLTEISNTKVMSLTKSFLIKKGFIKQDNGTFVNKLADLWFHLHSIDKNKSESCGFEHVFCGIIKKGKVEGLHNWFRIYQLQLNSTLKYFGYCRIKQPKQMQVEFEWMGKLKKGGSIFIGTSPELEMALYTICFLTNPGKRCELNLKGFKSLYIQTYTVENLKLKNYQQLIASAYPIV